MNFKVKKEKLTDVFLMRLEKVKLKALTFSLAQHMASASLVI